MNTEKISLIYPKIKIRNESGEVIRVTEPGYKTLNEETIHNLGLDAIVQSLSPIEAERAFIMRVLSHTTLDPYVAGYRADVFEDILNFPSLREDMMKILDKINFLKSYGTFKKEYEESASAFELIHRLEEINDYIICVEAIHNCLIGTDIKSEGLNNLREYVDKVYNDNAFSELKEDIKSLKGSTSELKSITLGINLNERFEAESIGVISINNKKFSKSGVIGNFSDAITARKGGVKDGNEWDEDYRFQPFKASAVDIAASVESLGRFKIASSSPIGLLTMAAIPQADSTVDVTRYMDRIVNHMLYITVKKLKSVLNKYVNVTITDITDLIPEFVYYIRFAEYVEKMKAAGYKLKKARVVAGDDVKSSEADKKDRIYTRAQGVYNILLAQSHIADRIDIVKNDLDFDTEHLVYVLTGANRGGKTTITVAIGQLFVLAQGGIYIPGDYFEYTPVDCIYTHFPADEDKTMDLGRLGEECKRFKELYSDAGPNSLILLNETFSTTSFEEGYYIARDAIRALLKKETRTIYNTHMHKLARDIDEINNEASKENEAKAQSLIVKTDGGERSFKIAVAPPEGMSYAEDIAKKYGVTYEMLTE
ncbi:MAG: DNA mismatch repair protein [Lachnospiraceae bacterium]|nr:DNA mismatch repair protein [Lachnospiraceae bacterium]